MTQITLKPREGTGSHSSIKVRRSGAIPGVIYGEGIQSRNFTLPESVVNKILKHGGSSSLFDVQWEGEPEAFKAIVHDWQQDPVSGRVRHVDLYQVRMDKTLHTEIPLHFVGMSLAVKDLGGTLVKQLSELAIECLPGDLVQSLEVSIEPLKTFEDHIKVKDLKLPPGIKPLVDLETIAASVSAPRSEAELASLSGEVKADVSAIEVLSEKKKEGEEATEAAEKTPAENKK